MTPVTRRTCDGSRREECRANFPTRLDPCAHPGDVSGIPTPGRAALRPRLLARRRMNALQFVVQGGHRLSGRIRPSGNKNAALPIVAAALLCEEPVYLTHVARIKDVEHLVELINSVGANATWTSRNALTIHAKSL